jgi:alkylhydroperoxidase family enzyme
MTLAGWVARRLGWSGLKPQRSRSGPLEGYLALATLPGFAGSLDSRTALLARELAARLSGCRWCIDRARHDCLTAGLPNLFLDELPRFTASACFSVSERAALAFVQAVAGRHEAALDVVATSPLSDLELAELTAIVAEHHCLQDFNLNLPNT